jgi:hypothetical protein
VCDEEIKSDLHNILIKLRGTNHDRLFIDLFYNVSSTIGDKHSHYVYILYSIGHTVQCNIAMYITVYYSSK